MLKKLRTQFVQLSVAMILFVIVASFACIYFITEFFIFKQSEALLMNVNVESIAVKMQDLSEKTIDISSYLITFALILDEQNQIQEVQSHFSIPMVEYQEAGKKALTSDKNIGLIRVNGKRWMFSKSDINNAAHIVSGESGALSVTQIEIGNRITFLDVTESYSVLDQFLIVFCIIGPLILLAIVGISFVFANRAISPISTFIEKQKRFISDASHELKTPIAIITTNAEAFLLNKINADEVEKWTNNIVSQSERMNQLVVSLLTFARSDEKIVSTPLCFIPVSEIVEEAITTVEAFFFF